MTQLAISYRRDDVDDSTRGLYDRLSTRFRGGNVAFDLDTVAGSVELVVALEEYERAVAQGTEAPGAEAAAMTCDTETIHKAMSADVESSAEKGEMLAMLAHELRSPLTVIAGLARMLNRGQLPDEGSIRSSLVDIGRSADRLDRIITTVMALGRADGEALELEPTDLRPILQHAGEAFCELSPSREVHVVPAEDLPLVRAHRMCVEEVIENLLSNADKYSPPAEPIEISASARGGEVVVSVRDRGSGIPEEERELVFAPFFRSSRNPGVPGSGIGLTLCRRLVEAQGGRISAASRPGGGAEVSFTLAVAPGASRSG